MELSCNMSGTFWLGIITGFILGFLLCIAVDIFESYRHERDKEQ